MSSRSGGASTRGTSGKAAEQAHTEKVARAEENVRKAQARVDDLNARVAGKPYGPQDSTDRLAVNRALRSAQTRLANLKAQGTPGAPKADKRAASYESRIAKQEARAQAEAAKLAALRAEYETYKRTGNAPTAATRTGARAAGTQASRPAGARLTPINPVNPELFGPDRPVDPYLLQHVYGNNQLRAALSDYPAPALRQAATAVEQRNPGSRPGGRLSKDALLDYVVGQVEGKGY